MASYITSTPFPALLFPPKTPSASSSAAQEHLAMRIRILYDLNPNMSLGYAIGGQILSFLKPDPS